MIGVMRKYPIVFALSGLFLIGIILPASLNYSGFCIAQGRYLSDDEKIRAVISYHNNRDTLPVGTHNYQQISYRSVEEFLAKNPNCCAVDPGVPVGIPPDSFFNRVIGLDSNKPVIVNYKMMYIDDHGIRSSQSIKFENVLTNCGKVFY